MSWSKKSALEELDLLLEQSTELGGDTPFSERHTAWLFRVNEFLTQIFGQDSMYYRNFQALAWRGTGSGVVGGPMHPEESMDPQLGIERLAKEGFQRALGTARGILQAARAKLESEDDIANLYESKDTGPEASLLIKAINLAEHKLRKVLREPPANEKALQDSFENLLVGADLPYSRETASIEYSSKTYTPDFTVDRADLAIELKVCLDEKREKSLPAEINDDILAYKQSYGNLLFVVYDTGNVRDIDRFIAHFEEEDGVVVKVVKH